jgi:CRP/FNR family transcriptional regulator, cyclic AMP receptor protein
MSTEALLKSVPLFAGLSDQDLSTVSGSLGRRVLAKGVFVYHKGSPGDVLYIVESGRVRSFCISDMGQEISLELYGPGEVFGELSAVDGRPRYSGAVTLEPTVLLTLRRADLARYLESLPSLAHNLLQLVAARARAASQYAEDLAFLDVNGRLAARLLELADRCGVRGIGAEVSLPFTQAELATWVAASRESVNKALGAFRARGLVQVEEGRITILDRRRLEREVQY